MQRTFLRSKIHRATVTGSELNYEGSCAIDSELLRQVDIAPYEQIQIYNINNGNRFTTYAIPAPENSGIIAVNGACARLAMPGDLVIICTYMTVDYNDVGNHLIHIIRVDERNKKI